MREMPTSKKTDMQIKVKFFGALTEITGTSEITLSSDTTDACHDEVKRRFLLILQYSYAIALNAAWLKENKKLNDGDELAFLPPFSGG
jgi:molybdopterin converting factor small subunit